jgi:hypothetical protein
MSLSLIDIAKKKGQNEQVKAYWNTYHCQSVVYSANGKLYGTYCKNRFCTLCCSIRKPRLLINTCLLFNNGKAPILLP